MEDHHPHDFINVKKKKKSNNNNHHHHDDGDHLQRQLDTTTDEISFPSTITPDKLHDLSKISGSCNDNGAMKEHGGNNHNKVITKSEKIKSRALLQSDSDTESEGSVEWDPKALIAETAGVSRVVERYQSPATTQPVLNEPSSIKKATGITRDVRHKLADVHSGVHGQLESASLLVEVPIHDDSDVEDEIPLSWQSSSRTMREQLIRDGYNLDLESDNEDLDLIPPKQNFGAGSICSCSGDSCTIS